MRIGPFAKLRQCLSFKGLITFAVLLPMHMHAQDVGMGERTGGPDRFEAPYTLGIETPHVPWAKPFPGDPIRLLAVPSVQEGRTLVELAQRLDLDLTTVTIDPAWDNNKWTMAFGEDYGARAERGDLKLVYQYLEEELVSEKEFDAILLPLHHGWEALTEASRQALFDRVKQGCGLVLIRPMEAEMSPLVPPAGTDLSFNAYRRVEPEFETGSWERRADHYISRAIPVESFPFRFLENYLYRPAPDAEVLVSTEAGTPVLAVKAFGEGRVVAFGYRNIGLSWRMSDGAAAEPVDLQWEYFYSLLVRSIIFAAGREPKQEPEFDHADVRWVLKKETGEVVRSGSGQSSETKGLEPGRYFLEQFRGSDWNIREITVEQPDRVENVQVQSDVLAEGVPFSVRFTASGPAGVTLTDGYQRVIARAASEMAGENRLLLTPGLPLTHGGFLEIRVGTIHTRLPVRFAASSREWSDYEIIMPWFGPRSYQPWTPELDEQFRKIGVTTLADPERNFKVIASVHEPVFGIYWYRKESYEQRKAEYLRTDDKDLIRRNISLHSPSLQDDMRERFKQRVGSLIPLQPFAYYLADESSLTCYADAFDVDFSPDDLSAFREWLRSEYDTLEDLNRSWGTSFEEWESVTPMTSREAQAHGNFASWSDHRVFMEEAFIRTIGEAGRIAREFDPEARAAFSGTQIPGPHNGANWYEIDQVADYLQPYSGGNQDAMHYLFNPKLRLTGFTGYGLIGPEVQSQVWRRLFYGHSGASIFWHYTLLNPDLTLSPQGDALAKAFGHIQSGVGRIFMNSSVIEDGVAIHFSMASIRGSWITDGKIVERVVSARRTSQAFDELMKRRDRWVAELERKGVQFRFLATPQIEAGELSEYKVLVLPYSIALSNREVEEIERFADAGGLVYLDEQTGRMDERLHWREKQVWTEPRENFKRSEPEDLEFERSLGIEGDFLTTVRRFGKARLFGLLPKAAVKVQIPASSGAQYDLLRGGRIAHEVAVSPEEPLLLLERARPVGTIEIRDDLSVHLVDDRGDPVDRSVVSIEVRDPEGKRIHYYSKNIDVVSGQGRFEIPFALNDAVGEWRIVARDVISGKTAELVLVRE